MTTIQVDDIVLIHGKQTRVTRVREDGRINGVFLARKGGVIGAAGLPVLVTAEHVGQWARITDQDSLANYRGVRGVVERVFNDGHVRIRGANRKRWIADPGCAVLMTPPTVQDDTAPAGWEPVGGGRALVAVAERTLGSEMEPCEDLKAGDVVTLDDQHDDGDWWCVTDDGGRDYVAARHLRPAPSEDDTAPEAVEWEPAVGSRAVLATAVEVPLGSLGVTYITAGHFVTITQESDARSRWGFRTDGGLDGRVAARHLRPAPADQPSEQPDELEPVLRAELRRVRDLARTHGVALLKTRRLLARDRRALARVKGERDAALAALAKLDAARGQSTDGLDLPHVEVRRRGYLTLMAYIDGTACGETSHHWQDVESLRIAAAVALALLRARLADEAATKDGS